MAKKFYLFFILVFTLSACGKGSFVDPGKAGGSGGFSSPAGSGDADADGAGNGAGDGGGDGDADGAADGSADGSGEPPNSVLTIDTFIRSDVIRAYNEVYQKPEPPMNWSGNVDTCTPGNTSLDYQLRVIEQINYYRAMSRLPQVTLITSNDAYMAGALLIKANNRLSHYPDSTWKCYDEVGPNGLASSNIAMGTEGISAINIYMDDFGSGNSSVGHRRWILFPSRKAFATGDVPGANSLAVWAGGTQTASGVNYVPWPSEGYIPYNVLPRMSNRWSFGKSGASFVNASVTMRNISTGENISVTLEPYHSGYGIPTLVWKPSGLSYSRPSQDTTYEVRISNVKVGSESRSYTYRVTVIDPND